MIQNSGISTNFLPGARNFNVLTGAAAAAFLTHPYLCRYENFNGLPRKYLPQPPRRGGLKAEGGTGRTELDHR